MPNRHRLLVNLAPFKRDNPNEIFVATDEPHGLITGTLRRWDIHEEDVRKATGTH
jgi:urate oxidase